MPNGARVHLGQRGPGQLLRGQQDAVESDALVAARLPGFAGLPAAEPGGPRRRSCRAPPGIPTTNPTRPAATGSPPRPSRMTRSAVAAVGRARRRWRRAGCGGGEDEPGTRARVGGHAAGVPGQDPAARPRRHRPGAQHGQGPRCTSSPPTLDGARRRRPRAEVRRPRSRTSVRPRPLRHAPAASSCPRPSCSASARSPTSRPARRLPFYAAWRLRPGTPRARHDRLRRGRAEVPERRAPPPASDPPQDHRVDSCGLEGP